VKRQADTGRRGRAVLAMQLAWVTLCVVWNVAGVYFVSRGMRSPGPTASLGAAAILVAIGAVLMLTRQKWPVAYIITSLLTLVMAGAAVFNAFTADPLLWPSDGWRWAGAALNGAGMVAATLAIVGAVLLISARTHSKRSRP
jgi:hypothetical protein